MADVDGESIASIQPSLERAKRLVLLLMDEGVSLAVGRVGESWRVEVKREHARSLYVAAVLAGD